MSSVEEQLLQDLIREKRSEKRWKNIRYFLSLSIILAILIMAIVAPKFMFSGNPANGYVSLVRLEGMIGPGQDFSAEKVLPALENAFSDKNSKGVILDINSGGGTPVQASIIHDSIIELKKRYHKKVVTVGEDMMASGAYYVAVASDLIYANPNSLTGSVGVIMKDFGFPELIKKIGIERRVYTSGANKDRLDPFKPQSPDDVNKIRQVISDIHANFQNAVLAGRGKRIKETSNRDELFSGDFWSGGEAVKLGLIDKLGNLSDVLRKEFDVEAYRDYSAQPAIFKNILGQFTSALDNLPMSHFKVMAQL